MIWLPDFYVATAVGDVAFVGAAAYCCSCWSTTIAFNISQPSKYMSTLALLTIIHHVRVLWTNVHHLDIIKDLLTIVNHGLLSIKHGIGKYWAWVPSPTGLAQQPGAIHKSSCSAGGLISSMLCRVRSQVGSSCWLVKFSQVLTTNHKSKQGNRWEQ